MIWNVLQSVDIVFRYPYRMGACALLLVIAVLAWRESRECTRALENPWVRLHILLLRGHPRWVRVSWGIGLCVAVILTAGAFAVPEKRVSMEEPVYGGLRLTFKFDSSRSMEYAGDVKPNRSRAAKNTIITLVDMLAHDTLLRGKYSLALIPFAGAAQPFFLPFTKSREEFVAALEEINERTITRQGTSVLSALNAYRELLWREPPREETVDVAILISDGGKEDGVESERNFIPAAIKDIQHLTQKKMREGVPPWKVVLYTVGMGKIRIDAEGRRIAEPVELVVRDGFGNKEWYRQDPRNPHSPVLKSRLDEDVLKEVARLGGGEYYHFTDQAKIVEKFRALVLTHRRVTDRIASVRYEPVMSWFLVPAFVLWYFVFGFGGWLVRIVRRIVPS